MQFSSSINGWRVKVGQEGPQVRTVYAHHHSRFFPINLQLFFSPLLPCPLPVPMRAHAPSHAKHVRDRLPLAIVPWCRTKSSRAAAATKTALCASFARALGSTNRPPSSAPASKVCAAHTREGGKWDAGPCRRVVEASSPFPSGRDAPNFGSVLCEGVDICGRIGRGNVPVGRARGFATSRTQGCGHCEWAT